jgi:hypothetical protein
MIETPSGLRRKVPRAQLLTATGSLALSGFSLLLAVAGRFSGSQISMGEALASRPSVTVDVDPQFATGFEGMPDVDAVRYSDPMPLVRDVGLFNGLANPIAIGLAVLALLAAIALTGWFLKNRSPLPVVVSVALAVGCIAVTQAVWLAALVASQPMYMPMY